MVEQRLDVLGLLHLPEVHAARPGAHEHAAPDHPGVDVEPPQVAQFHTGQLLVGRADVLLAHDLRQTRHPGQAGEFLKDHVREDDPRHVQLARAERRHLPVQHRDRAEVLVEHVADPRVTPGQHRLPGGDVGGEVVFQPLQALLDQRRAADVGNRELVPFLEPVQLAAQRCVTGRNGLGEESERLVRVGNRVQLRQHLDGRVLQCALLFGCGVGEPVAAEGVGHHVGRNDALDVIHQEERGAEHRALGIDPAHLRYRHVGEFLDQPDDVVLVVHPVLGEHRHVFGGGRHPGDPLLLDLLAVLGPAAGQDDGLRRHAVGVDAALDGHLRLDPAGHDRGQPLRQQCGNGADVATRALHVVDFDLDVRLVGHRCPPTLFRYGG